jgi:hypothetical protein
LAHRSAVDAELRARGWNQSVNPDIVVAYGLVVGETNTESFRAYARYLREGGRDGLGEAFVTGYETGTLILTLYEAGTGRLVWRASATAVVDSGKKGELARTAVREMLSRLPRE